MLLPTLRGVYESLHMKDSESIFNDFTSALEVPIQLKRNGKKLNDTYIIERILYILNPILEHIDVTIKENKGL